MNSDMPHKNHNYFAVFPEVYITYEQPRIQELFTKAVCYYYTMCILMYKIWLINNKQICNSRGNLSTFEKIFYVLLFAQGANLVLNAPSFTRQQ